MNSAPIDPPLSSNAFILLARCFSSCSRYSIVSWMYMSGSHARSGSGRENIRFMRADMTMGERGGCSGFEAMLSSKPNQNQN